ncbi:hypothetical protein GTR04_4804 [Trichophyton interdigitale]|uniref:Uncharacterized protein n=1 Tax=Trichophyton interdigitale TaxID=101480 RepID=A0A9P4YFT4_9EURO|nr:hypothetical protein GY631_4570 [Trichophyton interdigitale]KAF3892718.1 hypothetical protein GY632_4558 [Trichophyton interdigitale]KAG8207823.1 hypothetical protein GTR04_4804 [Trichophyton interdigitale]
MACIFGPGGSSPDEMSPRMPATASPDLIFSEGEEGEQRPTTRHSQLSTFERVLSTHPPILESFLLQTPTESILQLYHTSSYLRSFLKSYPTAWQYLSFRLLLPSSTQVRPLVGATDSQGNQRQSRPYALDQLLLHVIVPFSPSLRSLDLDNTAVSGQNLISIVLSARRDTLEHISVRGCKNVSLKYHIIPYLTMFGLQYDTETTNPLGPSSKVKRLAIKSLYTYRCRHHRRRPYLTSSLLRRDSDSEPTHELVNLCHKLGIWTDTAWCTTPAGRCFRRRGYVAMRAPQGSPEVWVVFDRLWRSKNWIGASGDSNEPPKRDGRLWEHDETGHSGEPLGTPGAQKYGEGKTVPTHLRSSHKRFVEDIKCDACLEKIHERCEQCSVLMHCVGCRKTLCYSCAYDTPYPRRKTASVGESAGETFWWAPGATISPCAMQEPFQQAIGPHAVNNQNGMANSPVYPNLKLHWCCTEPMFTGGGGITLGVAGREVDRVRAAPLPRGQGWEDPEYSSNEWSKNFPKYAYGDPKKPDYTLAEGHTEMMRWLLGPSSCQVSSCPRNLCQDCFDSPQWKVHCKSCSKPLCMEHDLRGLRLRICGYRDLLLEKLAIGDGRTPASSAASATSPAGPALSTSASYAPLRLAPLEQGHGGASSSSNPLPNETNSSIPATAAMKATDNQNADPASSSTSNNHTRSSTPASVYFEAAPQSRKWLGCQSFFCPQFRAAGDHRQRCTSVLSECTSCSVHVCQDCVDENPPCTCSYCDLNYLCPNCYVTKEQDGTCRRLEEERARRDEKQKRDLEMFEVALERNLANEVAGYAGQFFSQVYYTGEPVHMSEQPTEAVGEAPPPLTQPDGATNSHPPAQPGASQHTATYDEDDNGPAGSGSEHTEILGDDA